MVIILKMNMDFQMWIESMDVLLTDNVVKEKGETKSLNYF